MGVCVCGCVVVCLSVCLSLSVCWCVSICLCISLCVSVGVRVCLCVSVCLSLSVLCVLCFVLSCLTCLVSWMRPFGGWFMSPVLSYGTAGLLRCAVRALLFPYFTSLCLRRAGGGQEAAKRAHAPPHPHHRRYTHTYMHAPATYIHGLTTAVTHTHIHACTRAYMHACRSTGNTWAAGSASS